MDKGGFLVEAHLPEGRPVLELAAAHGVTFSWIYRLHARYREEGDAGLEPRSRRPRHSPIAIGPALEDEIVELRKHLADEELDAGAQTIRVHLERRHGTAPSVSTLMRILRRRGMVLYELRRDPSIPVFVPLAPARPRHRPPLHPAVHSPVEREGGEVASHRRRGVLTPARGAVIDDADLVNDKLQEWQNY